jgi:radical SAM protein with 4Fe4S-binding SPASM domain
MVATDKTVNQVDRAKAMWIDLGVDQFAVQQLVWRTKVLQDSNWHNKETTDLTDIFESIASRAAELGYSYNCAYLYQSAFVLSNGDVTPCSNPNARRFMVMGNIEHENLENIWNGERYEELRDLHRRGCAGKHEFCSTCEIALSEIYKQMEKDDIVI